MRLRVTTALGICLITSCSNDFAKSKLISARQASTAIGITTDADGNAIGSFSASATESQILKVTSGSLSGSGIAVPSGTLSIPITLTIGPGTDLTTPGMTDRFGLTSNPPSAAGPSVAFVPSQEVEVQSPFVLSIPFSRSTSLGLAEFLLGSASNYLVLYQGVETKNGVTTYTNGVLPLKSFRVLENSVEITTTILGTYQVVKVSDKVINAIRQASIEPPVLRSRVAPLTTISYLSPSSSYQVGVAIPENRPQIAPNERVSTFTITPPLPLGLSMSPSTGVISGTPTVASAILNHTITAVNDVSTQTVTVSIAIMSSGLSSPTEPSFATSTLNTERDSHSRHTFFDSVHNRHWVFYLDGMALRFRHSGDALVWTSGTALPGAGPSKFSLHYRNVAGSPYVFIVYQQGYDIKLLRGLLRSDGVTFAADVNVLDGSSDANRYKDPSVMATDSKIWVAASKFNGAMWRVHARASDALPEAALSFTGVIFEIGRHGSNSKTISLLPKGPSELYLMYKDGEAVLAYEYTQSNSPPWEQINTGGNYSWLSLLGTNGVNGEVKAAAFMGDDLYVGGDFTQAGGVAARGIAKWDGSSWSALGSGVSGGSSVVNALTVMGSELFIGGNFTSISGVSASNIAKWNGTYWSALGSGVDGGAVNALVANGGDLYVGGGFMEAGGDLSIDNIAKWNGSSWSAVGSGVIGTVNALAIMGGDLYAGGDITDAGGTAVMRIARWNGSAWSALGAGAISGSVKALAVNSTNTVLYMGGQFTSTGVSNTDRIAKWNGSTWSSLGSGTFTGSGVFSLAAVGPDTVYVGGAFSQISSFTAINIAKWNSSTGWGNLHDGMNGVSATGHVGAIAANGNEVFAAGSFTQAGSRPASNVAKWTIDISTWSSVGSGLGGPGNPTINALAFASDGSVYIGGVFNSVGGVSANNIAKWNLATATWQPLETGTTGPVYALLTAGSDLYVGGSFGQAHNVSDTAKIAKWDGTVWSTLHRGITGSSVNAIALVAPYVYVAGTFSSAMDSVGSNVAGTVNIARWNTSLPGWQALSGGVNSAVYDLEVDGSNLYVGGSFTDAGGFTAADQVAKWNGTAWSALGTGPGGIVSSIVVDGSDVVVAGGTSMNKISIYNGTVWNVDHTFSGVSAVMAVTKLGSFVFALGSNGQVFKRLGALSWSAPIQTTQSSFPGFMSVFGSELYLGTANGLSVYTPSAASTVHPFTAAINPSSNALTLAYVDSVGLVNIKTKSASWSAPTPISPAWSFEPQLSQGTAANPLVAFWYRDGGYEYRTFDASFNWTATTTLVSSSEMSRFASCDPFTGGGGIIKCLVTKGQTSPYELTTWNMTP